MSINLTSSPIWKKLFWIFSLAIMVLMPAMSHHYGQNGDEDIEAQYGRDIFNYYAHGDKISLGYDSAVFVTKTRNQQYYGQEFYGGMFDLMTEMTHRAFPSWEIMEVRHFYSSIFGALLMIFTGLLAYRLSKKKWWVALLALIFMFFSPRMFGDSMSNGKDIPFSMGMTMGTYYLVRILQDIKFKKNLWIEALLLAIGWSIILGMRTAGGVLFIAYTGFFIFIYYLFNREDWNMLKLEKRYLKGIVFLVSAFLLGSIIGYLTWPFGLQAPVKNLFLALKEMSNRQVTIRVLFEGKDMISNNMPWYYVIKWIFISSPIIILMASIAFILLLPKALKEFGVFAVILLLFSFFFPLLYIIVKHSTVYDSWRHAYFVYPSSVIMAALAIDLLTSFFSGKLKWIPLTVALLGMVPAIAWTVTTTPYQYVYFNQFVGGIQGAFGNYEIGYYQTSNREMAQWILQNIPHPKDGRKLIVRSNMDGMDTYFRKDTSWVKTGYARYYERNESQWDYYITYGRFIAPWQLQNGKWPPAHVVYTVKVRGVPIGVIIKRTSEDSYYAFQALKKNDFPTAVKEYQAFLTTDHSDEMVYMNYGIALASMGRIDEGIEALKKATMLDPTQPQFYQIIAQMYKAKGDLDNAQKALMQAQSIMAKEYLDSH